MTIATPLKLRWERAQQIDPSRIEEMGQGWYVVPSSRDPTGYAVHIEFDGQGKLDCCILHMSRLREAGRRNGRTDTARAAGVQARPGR